jgi:putative Mg2+ transporter-C (MgtC) family protein
MWDISVELSGLTTGAVILRLFLSMLFGGMIGLERGRRGRPAGMRTHMLVCMASALVMMTNQYIVQALGASDPARLGAQVISGVGFLGAGTIMVDRQKQIRGLTTAAGLWASACMGLAIGIGFYFGAIMACTFILLIIIILNKLENYMVRTARTMEVYVELEKRRDMRQFMDYLTEQGITILSMLYVPPRYESQPAERPEIAISVTLRLPKKKDHIQVMQYLEWPKGVHYIEEV